MTLPLYEDRSPDVYSGLTGPYSFHSSIEKLPTFDGR